MSLQSKNNTPHILCVLSGAIGDALLLIALCAEILRYQPKATIVFLTVRNNKIIGDLALAYPAIHVKAKQKGIGGSFLFLLSSFRQPFIALMPAAFGLGRFVNTDVLFTMLSLRPGTVTAGLRLPKHTNNPYQHSLSYDIQLPHIDNLRRMARLAGLTVAPDGSSVEVKMVSQMPKEFPFAPKKYVVFHPFGSGSWKSWPPSRSKILLLKLHHAYPHLALVLSASAADKKEAEGIVIDIPNSHVALDLPILELAGVLENAAAYIGVDTGITHLAGVLKVKSVVLGQNVMPSMLPSYNPNAVVLVGKIQYAEEEHLVIEDGKPYLRALYDITDEQILAALGALLDTH